MKNCVVVGGGLCGLFSAILLADKFEQVYIVEAEDKCGGLLKSVQDDAGVTYDQGTHIPNSTQVEAIDNILFGEQHLRDENWNTLGRLKTGNYFNGHWDLTTQIIDARVLPVHTYQQGLIELLERTEPSEAEDIVSYLSQTIGPTFTQEISAPLCKKLYGEDVDLAELMTNSSVNYFGLTRLLALSAPVSQKLKEIPAFDQKLGYHTVADFEQRINQDGIKECISYYPKKGRGVQYWVDGLIAQAKQKGVQFICNEHVNNIEHQQGKIKSVTLANSQKIIACDFLYWSAPPIFALKAANLTAEKAKVSFRTANIFHFTFDRPLLNTQSHYIWNWDLSMKSFRVTLLPNLRLDEQQSSLYNLSIEALSGVEDAQLITAEMMLAELVEMGIIAKEAKVVSQLRQTINNTFPVPTFDFAKSCQGNCQRLTDALDNIMISGRFSGKQWFHGDVIKAAYQEITTRFLS